MATSEWQIKDKQGNVLTRKSEGYEDAFHDGFAVAEKDKEFNFVDKDKNILSDEENFLKAEDFNNGLSRVRRKNGKYRLYKTDKSYLVDKDYNGISVFVGGFTRVWQEDGKFNLVSESGQELSTTGFEEAGFFNGGYCPVKIDGKRYMLTAEGKTIGKGYAWIGDISFGYFPVQTNEESTEETQVTPLYNFMNEEGEQFSDEEFSEVTTFNAYGIAAVKKADGLWYYLKTDKTYLNEEGFKSAGFFQDGIAKVRTQDDTYNLYSMETASLLLTEGVRQMHEPICGYRRVYNSDWQVNYLKNDGTYLLSTWTDKGYNFNYLTETTMVKMDGTWYELNTEGTLVEDEEYVDEEESLTIEEEESNGEDNL